MKTSIQPFPRAIAMGRSLARMNPAASALALLLGLTMTHPATAGAWQSDSEMLEEVASETDEEAFESEEDHFMDDEITPESTDGMEVDPMVAVEPDVAEPEPDEGSRLKRGLKRILVSALLIAAERKTHDALDIDAPPESDPEPEDAP